MDNAVPAWTDCTSYSRDDRDRIPTAFQVKSGALRIVVTNGHIACKGQWVMHCPALGIHTQALGGASSREDAQSRAIKTVEYALAELQADLEDIP